jgi:hypothetical protein
MRDGRDLLERSLRLQYEHLHGRLLRRLDV